MTMVHGEKIFGANPRVYETTPAATVQRPYARESALLLIHDDDHAQLKGSADDPPAAA